MIDEQGFFNWLLVAWFTLSAVTFVVLLVIPAPYGRHVRPGWGPRLPARIGWLLMESTVVVVFFACWILGTNPIAFFPVVFLVVFLSHYLYRAFVYPFRMGPGASMPLFIVGSGMLFNVVNGYLNGRWLFTLAGPGQFDWITWPRIALGCLIFFSGMVINHWADGKLRQLRKEGGGQYGIPRGGLYRLVSSPNYLGEIIEWAGWAIMTWSLPGLAFAVWTAANLVPRALHHHRWYGETFPDYPPGRRAIIPFIL